MRGKWITVTRAELIKASTGMIVHGYIRDAWIRSTQLHIMSAQEKMRESIIQPAGRISMVYGRFITGVTVSFKT